MGAGVCWASEVALLVENMPANTGVVRDTGSIPGSERSPGGGHGNLLQYSCLENLMDGGAWRATNHEVAQSRTRLEELSTHRSFLFGLSRYFVEENAREYESLLHYTVYR